MWPGAPPPRPRERRRVRRRTVAALVAVAIVAVVGAVIAALALTGRSDAVSVGPNSVGAIDPRSNRIVGVTAVGNTPEAVTTGLGSVWVVNENDQTLSRIDPATLTATQIGGLVAPTSVAVGGGSVWVATSDHTVSRVDPVTRSVASTTRLPRRTNPLVGSLDSSRVAAGPAGVWAGAPGMLAEVRPRSTRTPVDTCCGILAVGRDSVWTVSQYGLVHVDTASGTKEVVPVSFSPSSLAIGCGGVWATDTDGNAVWRIDPSTDQVRDSVRIEHPVAVACGAGSLWVASTDGTVVRVNPDSSPPIVVRTVQVQGTPAGLAVGENRVWVTVD